MSISFRSTTYSWNRSGCRSYQHPSKYRYPYLRMCIQMYTCVWSVIDTTHVCYTCMSAWVWYAFSIHTLMCIYIYIYICSHMRQNVLVTIHTVSRYMYITSITPVCAMGESNKPLRMARSAFSGRKTGSGLNGRKVGVHWRWWFQWWICLKTWFFKVSQQRDPNIWRYIMLI